MNPVEFFTFFSGRRLVFVGDSISIQHFQSFLCNLAPFQLNSQLNWADPSWNGKANCPQGSQHCYLSSSCIPFPSNVTVCFSSSNRGYTLPTDTVVLNFGLHMFSSKQLEETLKKFLIPSNATVIWRETSLQHFLTSDGAWPISGRSQLDKTNCGKIRDRNDIYVGETYRRNLNVTNIFASLGHRCLYTVEYAIDFHFGHINQQSRQDANQNVYDCTHWCLPGMPDLWSKILYNMLKEMHK